MLREASNTTIAAGKPELGAGTGGAPSAVARPAPRRHAGKSKSFSVAKRFPRIVLLLQFSRPAGPLYKLLYASGGHHGSKFSLE
jgi:hypothetical protein